MNFFLKRSRTLIKKVFEIAKNDWKRVNLAIPKRKYTKLLVYKENVTLNGCKNKFRQIIIKDQGRIEPTFIITNNQNLSLETVLYVYSKRWHIENKLSELVSFLNLNALSSPIMVRIHFEKYKKINSTFSGSLVR